MSPLIPHLITSKQVTGLFHSPAALSADKDVLYLEAPLREATERTTGTEDVMDAVMLQKSQSSYLRPNPRCPFCLLIQPFPLTTCAIY